MLIKVLHYINIIAIIFHCAILIFHIIYNIIIIYLCIAILYINADIIIYYILYYTVILIYNKYNIIKMSITNTSKYFLSNYTHNV